MIEGKANVLLVDDNVDLLQVLSRILQRTGHHVDMAQDGAAAVEKFKKHPFDITLMDVVMPRMNGVEALRRIREINPGARVILMTAYSEEELVRKALNEGAYEAVYKPLDIPQVLQLIGETISRPPILIVDDDPDFCATMARLFELKGYRVWATFNGEEAIKIAAQRTCHIAFVDVKLPQIDGLQTSLQLKEINPDLSIFMITGYGDEVRELVEKALATSAVDCLHKPLDPSVVLELVRRMEAKVHGKVPK